MLINHVTVEWKDYRNGCTESRQRTFCSLQTAIAYAKRVCLTRGVFLSFWCQRKQRVVAKCEPHGGRAVVQRV